MPSTAAGPLAQSLSRKPCRLPQRSLESQTSLPQTQPSINAFRRTRAAMLHAGSFQVRSHGNRACLPFPRIELHDLEPEGVQLLTLWSRIPSSKVPCPKHAGKASLATCRTLFRVFHSHGYFGGQCARCRWRSGCPCPWLAENWSSRQKQALVGAILLMTLLTAFCVTRPFKL